MNSPHPVKRLPGETPEQALDRLYELVAQLWDQVWWLSLSHRERAEYERHGFRDPMMTRSKYEAARTEGVEGHINRFYE